MEAYEIVKDLGSGNFGVAKLVRDKRTKELFAVKFIERGQKVSCPFFFFLFLSHFLYLVRFLFPFLFCNKLRSIIFWSVISMDCRLMNTWKGKS